MMEYAWLVPLFPLLAFILLIAFGKQLKEGSAYIGILATLASLVVSLGVWMERINGSDLVRTDWDWLKIGDNVIRIGFEINPLNAMMLVVVSLVSFLVHIYSKGYMHGDDRFPVFYQYLGLFTFAMLGLVISPNLLQVYIFWELVGVASFLLVGFYFYKPEAKAAAKKAFIVTRIGDVGLFIAIALIYWYTSSFEYDVIFSAVTTGTIPAGMVTLIAILIFIGAVGKSGQFPLHTWLPDAMEGPTPVSALIHAATMVAAGVYLVAATYPLFEASHAALLTVAFVGGFTAIFAASIGLVQNDIKRVLAYSTVSQLGYMMLALGVGGYVAGVFHLFTHAFFKALLFLAAGSVIHALHTNDINEMGGLGKKMKWTSAFFLIGALALAGVPPFSGFFSKEAILAAAYEKNMLLFVVAVIAAFFTAFYMFRLFFLVFTGESRNKHAAHESPMVMVAPMFILAILAVVAGFVNTPWGTYLGDWLNTNDSLAGIELHEAHAPLWTAVLAVAVALLGILLAYLIYAKRSISREFISKPMPWLYKLLLNKYYVDELYNILFVKSLRGLGLLLQYFDRYVVGGLVQLVVSITTGIGALHARIQNGQVQMYGAIVIFGLTLLLAGLTLVVKGVIG
jgi:NADH-quinone oxidoreductase subunit L